jgi:hypothetical protein
LLIEVAANYPALAEQIAPRRAPVASALTGDADAVARAIAEEESQERRLDRLWWQPLPEELEKLRHAKREP